MFVLSEIQDCVRLLPSLFGAEHTVALTHSLNEKYTDKVLHNVGHCVCVYDVVSYGESVVHPGDDNGAASWTNVRFRLVVFRPSVGEVIVGRIIESSSERGVRVSIGFFKDIWVPPEPAADDGRSYLEPQGRQSTAVFDTSKGLWAVKLQEGEDEPAHFNYYELDMPVRFRVVGVSFDNEVKAPFHRPPKPASAAAEPPPAIPPADPMHVTASFADPESSALFGAGLGPIEWWEGDEEEVPAADAPR
eukprot:TRINITY_DN48304_c0_g1_i1.p1 TRINITY_DN48304_c0_g1~~TRINITY_DN48304_c0_g1_i1.p1  ORF type:complete len:267 (+),score=95.62 TRINITY_DN48304_c0_g1_i1:61-801(+)